MNGCGSSLRLALMAIVATAAHVGAQQAYFNPRDDQYRYLGMVRMKAELHKATEEYDRARELAGRGMLSNAELSERRLAFERVRVDYLQQSLSTLLAAAHLVIDQAIKDRRPDGSLGVTVRVRSVNAQSAADEKARGLIDTSLAAALHPDVIPAVFVSLKAEGGAAGVIISKPYELLMRNVRIGETREARFTLLKDVSDLVVGMSYADKTEERRVLLDNAGAAGATTLRAGQFSLEGDFGATVTYDLVLERATMSGAALRLGIDGLPSAVRYEFRDPDSKSRVVQVRFPDGQTLKRLQLVVSLPSATDGVVRPDAPLKFAATAAGEPVSGPASGAGGRAELELIPRGIARAELRTTSLYYEASPNDSLVMDVAVRNAGSRAIERAAVTMDAAAGWRSRSEPAELTDLRLGESRPVKLILVPKGEASVGDYENRVRVMSLTTDRRLDDEDKIIRVRVASRFGMWATSALLAALTAMTAGVVVAAKRLGKR
jgi:hypothetical protein